MPIGDIYQLRVATDWPPQCAINIMHWYCTSQVGPGALLSDIAKALSSQIAGPLRNILGPLATYRGVGARLIYPILSAEVAYTGDAGPGLDLGDMLPSQTSGKISFKTLLTGRRGHGKFYVPFPSVAAITVSGTPNILYVGLLNALRVGLLAPFIAVSGGASTSLKPVLWGKTSHVATDITSSVLGLGFATQRRRGFYGRPNPPPF